jgi:glycosyltransferase involved in cell wall biosynthesis
MKARTLIYSGNLGLGHDFETIINAAYKLRKETNLRILFIGNGKAKDSLKKLTNKLNLKNIKFRPPVPLNRLSRLLAIGDIHLVTQKLGTQGLIVPSKIYGILAAARPTLFIGPENCEPAMILRKSQAGIVVKPKDIDAVTNALRHLLIDHQLRITMGKLAREYYESNFGKNRSISKIVKTIETLKI